MIQDYRAVEAAPDLAGSPVYLALDDKAAAGAFKPPGAAGNRMPFGNGQNRWCFFERHLAIDEALAFRQGTAVALWNLGRLYRRLGDYPRARHHYEACRDLSRTYDLPWDRATASYGLGMVALHEGDPSSAGAYFRRYYRDAPADAGHMARVDILFGFAAIAAATNRTERAARLLGAAAPLLAAGDYRLDPFDRAEFERHLALARAQLGEDAFAALAEKGAQMGVEETVPYAMAGLAAGA